MYMKVQNNPQANRVSKLSNMTGSKVDILMSTVFQINIVAYLQRWPTLILLSLYAHVISSSIGGVYLPILNLGCLMISLTNKYNRSESVPVLDKSLTLVLYLTTYLKINLRWIIGLIVKAKTIKILKEKWENIFTTLSRFLRTIQFLTGQKIWKLDKKGYSSRQ